jgi:hypothetical protein
MKIWRVEDVLPHDQQQHDAAVDHMAAILGNRDPRAQGAILADLVGCYFAGYHPETREEQIELWTETLLLIIEFYDERILASFGGARPQ